MIAEFVNAIIDYRQHNHFVRHGKQSNPRCFCCLIAPTITKLQQLSHIPSIVDAPFKDVLALFRWKLLYWGLGHHSINSKLEQLDHYNR